MPIAQFTCRHLEQFAKCPCWLIAAILDHPISSHL